MFSIAAKIKQHFNRPTFPFLVEAAPSVTASNGQLGRGCGSVGRAVASDTRGLPFESSHWQTLI